MYWAISVTRYSTNHFTLIYFIKFLNSQDAQWGHSDPNINFLALYLCQEVNLFIFRICAGNVSKVNSVLW